MKKLIVLVVMGLLVGCATEPIRLSNPKTGQIAQCGPYTNMHPLFPALSPHWKAERECIQDFQRQGYERLWSPK
jgi:hypothetical protein